MQSTRCGMFIVLHRILSVLLLPSKVLLLVEQIRPRTAQIDDLRTPVSILLKPGAFEAIKCV